MVQPIKITQVNRPLTCEEHDANIDALLDRANHTGTQNCNTIESTSLNSCISSSASFTSLDNEVDLIDARLQIVENAIAGGGTIDTDLQNVRSELLNEIDLLEITLNNHDSRITALEGRADGFDSSIISINNSIAFEVGQLQSQITGNDNDILIINSTLSNHDTRINDNTSGLSTEISNRTSADAVLTGDLNTEIANRIAGDGNLQTQITSEASTRGSADTTLQNNINGEALTRQAEDAILRADFEAADLALQAQITALQGQIDAIIPIGTIAMWAGVAIPTGWLLCDGALYNRSGSPQEQLYQVIGTQYGTTSASNFRVPNFNGRFPKGQDSQTAGSQGGALGGENSTVLTAVQLPPHTHTIPDFTHTHDSNIDHHHGLTIQGHTHTGGGGGSHYHRLSWADTQLSERNDDESGGGRPLVENRTRPVGTGTAVGSGSGGAADFSLGDWRTTTENTGAAINAATEVIKPNPGDPFNITDQVPVWAQIVTSGNPSVTVGGGTTGTTGLGDPIENRPAYIDMKFIIKF